MASSVDVKDICKTLGIELAIYEEESVLWLVRMQEDNTFEVTTLFRQYFGEADNHLKLKNVKAQVSEDGKSNMEKLKTDCYFYEELN